VRRAASKHIHSICKGAGLKRDDTTKILSIKYLNCFEILKREEYLNEQGWECERAHLMPHDHGRANFKLQ
jgi:hypothetical protein